MSKSSILGPSQPKFYFEPFEIQWLSPLGSPPKLSFKVNSSLLFRIKQERCKPHRGDPRYIDWYAYQPITFIDDDLSARGMHTSTLYLEVYIMGFTIRKVLIDGGSSVNICLLRTAQELGIRRKKIQPTTINVVDFDGHFQTPLEKIILPITVYQQDEDRTVELYITNVKTTYNMIHERPWIYSQNAVASTPHQMVRQFEGKVVFMTYAKNHQGRPNGP